MKNANATRVCLPQVRFYLRPCLDLFVSSYDSSLGQPSQFIFFALWLAGIIIYLSFIYGNHVPFFAPMDGIKAANKFI